jgi:hypothetical protein
LRSFTGDARRSGLTVSAPLMRRRRRKMETPTTQPGTGSTLQAYEDKIAAQIHAANTRIDEFEATAKPKRAQAEITAINGLKATRQNIETMLVDLKTTRDAQVVRGKADIDAAIVAFQASLEDVRRKFTTPSEKK